MPPPGQAMNPAIAARAAVSGMILLTRSFA
jgi:hypothetical protein